MSYLIVRSATHEYTVVKLVAEDKRYRLYLCTREDFSRQCLLQIATEQEYNGKLDLAAYILKQMETQASQLEEEYMSVKKDPNIFLNYGLGFPELVESFIADDQDGRRYNIIAFRKVKNVEKLAPLINITQKDRLRVDLRTSAWIMGKLLKTLVFAHSQGISVGIVNPRNVIIEKDEHYVLILDWSAAQMYSDEMPIDIQRQEISKAAKAVIVVLGGDFKKSFFPDDGEKFFAPYTQHILRLARQGESCAQRAHSEFYELIDQFWPREFYPFTTKPL